jgi:hypothetical protein
MKLNKWQRVDRRSSSYRHVLKRIYVFPRPLYVVLRDTAQAVHANPVNAELNPICRLLAPLGPHHVLHVSRIRVNCILLSKQGTYIY